MIWESWPWKRELFRIAERLERRLIQARWLEATSASVERDVMIAAYSIRKLIEAQTKVPHAIARSPVNVQAFRSLNDGKPDLMRWDEIARWFDLDHAESRTLSLEDLCNQLIHSWVFILGFSEDRLLDSIFVSSDRARARVLYHVSMRTLIEVIRRVAVSDVTGMTMKRAESGQWEIVESVDDSSTSDSWPPPT